MLMPLASMKGTGFPPAGGRHRDMGADEIQHGVPMPHRIDVHFHLIPPFYVEAVYAAGRGPAIGRYPDWSPGLALATMDRFGIAVALTSLAQPGVGFERETAARTLARRCNDYAADLI